MLSEHAYLLISSMFVGNRRCSLCQPILKLYLYLSDIVQLFLLLSLLLLSIFVEVLSKLHAVLIFVQVPLSCVTQFRKTADIYYCFPKLK